MSLTGENVKRWAELKRVAWIRVGALGDLLVGMAALVETHSLFPKAKLTIVGPKLWPEILSPREYPYVERIAVIERKGFHAKLFKPDGDGWKPDGEMPLKEVLGDCDGVVNLNIDSYRYGFTSLRAGCRVRVGSAASPMAWLYNYASPFFGKDPLVHERDAALMVLEYATAGGVRFFRSTERNRVNLSDWVERSQMVRKWRGVGLPPGKKPDLQRARDLTHLDTGKYVLVNPTSSRREKAWPAEKFRELILQSVKPLAGQDISVLVLGAPHETEWLREVAGSEVRIVQPPSVRDLQDVLSGSRGLLTNTSSVQFIAAMTGTPAVVLMGRGRPEIWGPLGPEDVVVRGAPDPSVEDIFLQEQKAYEGIAVDAVRDAFLGLPNRRRVR